MVPSFFQIPPLRFVLVSHMLFHLLAFHFSFLTSPFSFMEPMNVSKQTIVKV